MRPRGPGGLLSKERGGGGGAWPAWPLSSLLSFAGWTWFPVQPCFYDKPTKAWDAWGQQELEE